MKSARDPALTALLLLAPAGVAVVIASTRDAVWYVVLLLGLAVFAITWVTYRTSSLTWDLTRERRLSEKLDEALAQVIEQRDQLTAQRYELQRLALSDDVTGLGNRVLLRNRAEELGDTLADAALLLVDLDRFNEVNDTLGHSIGDALLRQIGDRLEKCVRPKDTVVRLGGDEFAVLLPDTGAWVAARTADRLLDELRRPVVLKGQPVEVRGSIGIAGGTGARGLDELLRNADLAMYQAKARGRDRFCEFSPGMVADTSKAFNLGLMMREGLARGEFRVYYQPIVEAGSGRVLSLEALVRWEHPFRGLIPPSEFLPTAQLTGLMVELGQFVLQTACEQTASWRRKWPWLTVAVNASQRELLHPEFTPHVAGVLAMTGLDPDALCLEVTETVLAAEEQIREILEPLKAIGVMCSLDDFGTGYSSLSRLRDLPVDRVKVDRSFVVDVADDRSDGAALLASIISLAHSLGLKVVAEGVETKQQADFLAAHDCEELQGFYFSRPLPSAQVPSALLSSEFLSSSGPSAPQSHRPAS